MSTYYAHRRGRGTDERPQYAESGEVVLLQRTTPWTVVPLYVIIVLLVVVIMLTGADELKSAFQATGILLTTGLAKVFPAMRVPSSSSVASAPSTTTSVTAVAASAALNKVTPGSRKKARAKQQAAANAGASAAAATAAAKAATAAAIVSGADISSKDSPSATTAESSDAAAAAATAPAAPVDIKSKEVAKMSDATEKTQQPEAKSVADGGEKKEVIVVVKQKDGSSLEIVEELVPEGCYPEQHADYAGDAVWWGLGHKQPSAAACCKACQDFKKNHPGAASPCNVWVWCGDPSGTCWTMDIHDHTTGDCWLKFQKGWDGVTDLNKTNLGVNHRGRFDAEFRGVHKSSPEWVPWVAGVVPPQFQAT